MLRTAQAFIDQLKEDNLKMKDSRDVENGKSVVVCGFNGKNNAVYDVFMIFDEDNVGVSLRVFRLVAVPEDRTNKIYDVVNDLNLRFRWVKFFCDHDSYVNVQEDATLNEADCGKTCVRMMMRAVAIIDAAYPDLMRAIWA